MKKYFLIFFILIFIKNKFLAVNIEFPIIQIYTGMDLFQTNSINQTNLSYNLSTSYILNLLIDTGKKYNFLLELGFSGYNIKDLNSNYVNLNSIKATIQPFNLFNLCFFIGNNSILGYNEIGYQGFQFHKQPGVEYIGYNSISGIGIDTYLKFYDEILEPHLLLYEDRFTKNINLDTLTYIKLENILIEIYGGISINSNFFETNNIFWHFGFMFKTVYAKMDIIFSTFIPDTPFNTIPDILNSAYLQLTVHGIRGWFEWNGSFFVRPTSYNNTIDLLKDNIDLYTSLGFYFDNFRVGTGLENTFIINFLFPYYGDTLGLYFYIIQNNLKFKTGIYVEDFLRFKYGAYVNIIGKI